ncbi:hypothetical protein ABZ639_23820 [Saccharomonospora sp. NPDC006951]
MQSLGAVRASVSPTVARLLVVVGFAIAGLVLAALFGSSAMAQESPSAEAPHDNRQTAETRQGDVIDPGSTVPDEVADRREQAVDELSTPDTQDAGKATEATDVDGEPVAEAEIRHSAAPFAASPASVAGAQTQALPTTPDTSGGANPIAVAEQPAPAVEPAEQPAPQRPLLGGILGTTSLGSTLDSTLGSTLNATVAGLTGTVNTVTNTVHGVTSTLTSGIAPGVTVPIGTPIPGLDALLPDLFEQEPLPGEAAEAPADRAVTEGTDGRADTKTPATTAPSTGRAHVLPWIPITFEEHGNAPLTHPEPPAKNEVTVAGGGSGDGGSAPKPAAPAGLTSTSSGFVAAHDGAASGKSVHGVLSWAPTLTQLRFIAASRDHDTAGAGREAALPTTSPD